VLAPDPADLSGGVVLVSSEPDFALNSDDLYTISFNSMLREEGRGTYIKDLALDIVEVGESGLATELGKLKLVQRHGDEHSLVVARDGKRSARRFHLLLMKLIMRAGAVGGTRVGAGRWVRRLPVAVVVHRHCG
jgi:hypothetical protein